MKKKIVLISALAFAMGIHSTASTAKEVTQLDRADAAKINVACETDARATNCTGMTMGKGLLKCMQKFKQGHKEYRFSENCRDAIKQLKADRDAGK